MKTLCDVKREWIERINGIMVYHSPELDRIGRQLGDMIYRQREKEVARARERRASAGDYRGYGNGLGYMPELVSC